MISMTWPQYQRRECKLMVSLSPHEAEIVFALLIRRPCPMTAGELVEVLYPDPDAEPAYAQNIVCRTVINARRKGVPIVTTPHGYKVAA